MLPGMELFDRGLVSGERYCYGYKYFWNPTKASLICSGWPRSATASARALLYLSLSRGESFSWSSSSTPSFTYWESTKSRKSLVERDETDSVDVYFCNYARDEETAEALRSSEADIRRDLGGNGAIFDLEDTRDAIGHPLGVATVDDVDRLVPAASELIVKYLQVLKPILGDLF